MRVIEGGQWSLKPGAITTGDVVLAITVWCLMLGITLLVQWSYYRGRESALLDAEVERGGVNFYRSNRSEKD